MKLEGQQGSQSLGSAAWGPLRLHADGSLHVINGNGKHSDAAMEGRLFSVCNQTVTATTAALATTWTGLGIANPSTSGKNVIIHEFAWALRKKPDGESSIGLMESATVAAFADSLTAICAKDGAGTSAAYADAAAVIDTPILTRIYQSFGESENWIHSPIGLIDLNGSIILPPGRCVTTYTSKIFAECQFHFVWEEVDV